MKRNMDSSFQSIIYVGLTRGVIICLQVIQTELLRNLGLASACVFVVVLLLLANIWQTILVFCCVIFTLVSDVKFSVYIWYRDKNKIFALFKSTKP